MRGWTLNQQVLKHVNNAFFNQLVAFFKYFLHIKELKAALNFFWLVDRLLKDESKAVDDLPDELWLLEDVK